VQANNKLLRKPMRTLSASLVGDRAVTSNAIGRLAKAGRLRSGGGLENRELRLIEVQGGLREAATRLVKVERSGQHRADGRRSPARACRLQARVGERPGRIRHP